MLPIKATFEAKVGGSYNNPNNQNINVDNNPINNSFSNQSQSKSPNNYLYSRLNQTYMNNPSFQPRSISPMTKGS